MYLARLAASLKTLRNANEGWGHRPTQEYGVENPEGRNRQRWTLDS